MVVDVVVKEMCVVCFGMVICFVLVVFDGVYVELYVGFDC